jgi:hypothetical protein
MHMNFWIDLEYNGLPYRFLVNYLSAGQQLEHFQVTAGSKQLLISSNRPLLRQQGNLATPTYILKEGKVTAKALLPKIYQAIDEYMQSNLNYFSTPLP